jgi:hypothetical protein
VASKNRVYNFWKYSSQRFTHISQILTDVGKLREFFEEEIVLVKNLSHFPKIHFHIIGIYLQKR